MRAVVSVRFSKPPSTRVQALPLAAFQASKAVRKSAVSGLTPSMSPEMNEVVSVAGAVE